MIRWKLFLILAIAGSLAGVGPAVLPARGQGAVRTFPETRHTVTGRFLQYWEQHGGLAQNGYPLTEELNEASPLNGRTYTVQYFERTVFEYHPENKPPYDVLLSQLGTLRFKDRYPNGVPSQQASTQNALRFPETNHSLGGVFRAYWEQHGGLSQNGYPISEEFMERSDLNGQTYKVQYFERAVFEYHPENQPSAQVLLSQLGRFHLVIQQAKKAVQLTPSPPRIYAPKGNNTGLWPDDTGSTVTTYSTCGIVPAPGAGQEGTTCEQPMTLTTDIAPEGTLWRVTFSSAWATGSRQHRWAVRVAGDGTAASIQETGDPLPILPQ